MSNTFGRMFRFTTWGESHGHSLGVVIDGCPAGMKLDQKDIQKDLDRRRPGQSRVTTQRKEADRAEILSGVFEGYTTGSPISIVVKNQDADSSKYEPLRDTFRPGHADFTYYKKWGRRDHRGGGRSSARETLCRVAAGSIAKKILNTIGVSVFGFVDQIENIVFDEKSFNKEEIERNNVRCPDKKTAKLMEDAILKARKDGDSVGGGITILAENVPSGLGEPLYGRLDSDLASALMSINAVKGVEIGAGFDSIAMRGSENNDPLTVSRKKTIFKSNNSGGILGGISTGDPIKVRFAVKPTSSILMVQDTVTTDGKKKKIKVEGRHDPCVATRAVPIGEAMVAIVLVDHWLMSQKDRID